MSDLWNVVKKGLAGVAPILGNAILPGVGGVAGSLVAQVLGVDPEPEIVSTALLNATPEQITALKQAEYTHQERLIELATENDKAYLSDVQNARQREVDITSATGERDINLYILAWVVVCGFFSLVGMLMYVTLPDRNIGPINQLFGAMAAGFGMVLAYFFGSSKGSSEKTEALMQLKGKG
ncbi:MAG: hypothetical protein WC291_08285 [Thermodesulfovibrionales bacterium]|jgi:hypothetical protein